MRTRLAIGIFGLLTALGLVGVGIAQEPAKSETEILAEREFREGERIQRETSIASHNLEGETRDSSDTRAHEYFVIPKKDAKPYVADPKRPFAHPFFWSPFVLIGNWR